MKDLAIDGFHVAPALLSPGEIAALRAAISDTIDRVAEALRAPFSTSRPDAPLEERLDQVAAREPAYALTLFQAALADTHRDERIDVLVAHERLATAIADLIQPLVATGSVIRPRAAVSAFPAARHAWHQDVTRPTPNGSDCGSVRLACWIPLMPVDEETGALEIAAGAWRQPLPHERDGHGRFFIPDDVVPARGRQVVPLAPGDVLFIDRFLPHRALEPRGGRARWAMVMWVKAALPS